METGKCTGKYWDCNVVKRKKGLFFTGFKYKIDLKVVESGAKW